MVDTVLSRDKNWVRWKAEGCPLIERAPVSMAESLGAREQAAKTYANKRIRPSPMGSLDLKFLSEGEVLASVDRLKEPGRYVPTHSSHAKQASEQRGFTRLTMDSVLDSRFRRQTRS